MAEQSSLLALTNLINKLIIFSRRADVRLQVILILFAFFAAAFISKSLWLWLKPRLEAQLDRRASKRLKPWLSAALAMVKVSTFPLLGVTILTGVIGLLANQGRVTGLVSQFVWMFWIILAFQLVIQLLYLVFGEQAMRRYHYRLLLPLLIVIILLQIINDLTSVDELARIVLIDIFTNPVTLGALFIATLGLYFWTDIVNVVQDLIYQLITRHTPADPGSTKAMLTLMRYILIVAGVIFALSQLRLDATTMAAITGGLSVGIGFGLREILSNFISGIFLLFERSLHPGDVIEIDGQLCVVQNLNIRTTKLRTLDNIELVIPNQTFFTASFQTYTGGDKTIRVPMVIHTSCDNDIEQVILLLQETALAHEDVLQTPQPAIFFNRFGDNVAEFQLNVWLDTPLKIPAVKSDVRRMIWHAFQRQNIDLTFPDMALHFPDKMPAMPISAQASNGIPTS